MYKNILLIKMSSLGDVIHTLPFAYELRRLYPDAKITWLVHPQFGTFIPMQIVDEVIYFDKVEFNKASFWEKLRQFWTMRKNLQNRHFDLVVDLQGLFKSAVLAAISGCHNRIGYCEMREGSKFISRPIIGAHAHAHVIERYLDVARYLGAQINEVVFPMPDLEAEAKDVAEKLHLSANSKDYVVIVPGARWETKCWPVTYYGALAQKIAADGKTVVLAGGKEDMPKGREIKKLGGLPNIIDLTGQTSLKELVALIKNCQVYISADTGPLHFAAALKKPLVCMYGPTLANRTGPYGDAKQIIIHSSASCVGCLKKHCDNWHCMHDISVDEVYEAYLKLCKCEV